MPEVPFVPLGGGGPLEMLITGLPLLMQRIRQGDPYARIDFCEFFERGLRALVVRRFGPDLPERVVSAVLSQTVQAVEEELLTDAQSVTGYILATLRSLPALPTQEDSDSKADIQQPKVNGAHHALFKSRQMTVRSVVRLLAELPEDHQEALRRYYIEAQSEQEILRDLKLTRAQLNLIRMSAVTRFAELKRESASAGGAGQEFRGRN